MINHEEISTISDLANYLRCPEDKLNSLINNQVVIVDNKKLSVADIYRYSRFDEHIVLEELHIPKKNPKFGFRTVFAVWSHLFSYLLKTLNTYLSELYLPEENIHGFLHKKNIKTNAQQHLSKKYLLSVDIKDFFETITISRVRDAFISLGYQSEISDILSKLVTLNGVLVQGYSTSPILANIVAKEMDKDLIKLCTGDVIYTRYADDLYFSSNIKLPDLKDIQEIINKHGFELNPDKTKYMPKGSKQYVTGLSVFDKICPRIPRNIKRNLRLEIYHIKKWGVKSHILKKLNYSAEDYFNDFEIRNEVDNEIMATNARINGWIQFIKSIEYTLGLKLHEAYVHDRKFSKFRNLMKILGKTEE